MEFVIANAGKIKRETYNGRSYVVAPVTMIVPGVLNGSQGALYYPPDEVSKDVGIWNAVPLTIGHPFDSYGQNVSARSPETLDKFQIGYVFNDRVENGNRLADGYFDVEWTKAKAPEVYAAINAGKPMELSTGLYTSNVPVDNGRSPKGDAYQFVARDYRPDHLAILPNQRGACSIKDGCGLNVNAESDVNKKCGGDPKGCVEIDARATTTEAGKKHLSDNAAPNQPKSLNTGKYKRHGAGTGKGAPHQSAQDGYHGGPKPCECGTCEECMGKSTLNTFCPTGPGGGQDNSCGKEGSGSGSSKSVGKDRFDVGSTAKTPREHKQAKAYHEQQGKLAREGGNKKLAHLHYKAADAHHDATRDRDESFKRDAREASKDIEDYLTRNIAYNQSSNFRPHTNNQQGVVMNRDDNIKWLTANCECHKNKAAVLANADNYSDAEIDALVKNEQGSQAAKLVVNGLAKVLPEIGTMAINEIPAFVEGKMKKDDEEEVPVEGEEETEEEVVENKKKVDNAKRPTAQEWLDSAPAEIRELVGNALQQKSDLVKRLTANTKNAGLRDKLAKQYMQLSINDLKDMIADMPKPAAKARPIVNDAKPAPLYLGSFTPTVNEAPDEADLLVPPTINWAESAKRK